MASRRRPPPVLRIDTPAHNPAIVVALASNAPSDDSDDSPFSSSAKPRPLRNLKRLSLVLPPNNTRPTQPYPRPTVVSLPNPVALRQHEDADGSIPYSDGPVQFLPGIWLGSEDNARDWSCLTRCHITAVLNLAKEVAPLVPPALHAGTDPSYLPSDPVSGRPALRHLKLSWSHGQQDLVRVGFPAAMAFTDAALRRNEGILIHCQCGISRSATLAIALVMRAAAERDPSVPSHVWALDGMQDAYSFVKQKSRWISPNMSLIYQLLEYEKVLKSHDSEISKSMDDEQEWTTRRLLFDKNSVVPPENPSPMLVAREAQALDSAMENRARARHSSFLFSTTRLPQPTHRRSTSAASKLTTGSLLSEHLFEESEEELLGVSSDLHTIPRHSPVSESEPSSASVSPSKVHITLTPQKHMPYTPTTAHVIPPPPLSPPITRENSPFDATPRLAESAWQPRNLTHPPQTAARASFYVTSPAPFRQRRRPVSIDVTSRFPSPPASNVLDPPSLLAKPHNTSVVCSLPPPFVRSRTQSRKPSPPPPHLLKKNDYSRTTACSVNCPPPTPSQTLVVFPPSPTLSSSQTPSAMTLVSSAPGPVPFPRLVPPKVSAISSRRHVGSFIGVTTTAFSKVDARGHIGLE